MFGAPLTPIKSVNDAVKESPKISQSFHSFYLKDDHIPKLLRFLDVNILSRNFKKKTNTDEVSIII